MQQGENDEDVEFERLGAFLAELDPRHAAARPHGSLDAGAPRRLAALWRRIGVSEVSMPHNPWTSLSAAESRRIMSEIFEEWFDSAPLRDRWGVEVDDHRAAWDRLPSRFRVVAAASPPEKRSVLREVALTDESTDLDDPPVVVFPAEGKSAILWHSSYVQWQIWTMLRGVKGARWASFDARCGITGTPVLPTVYPWLETLAEGVWRLREPGLLRQDVRPADADVVFYRSPSCYFKFARSLGDAELARLSPPYHPGRFIVSPGALDLQGPGFRTVPRERRAPFDTSVEAIGRLEGADVWIAKHADDEAVLWCDPKDQAAIRSGLERLGGRVIRNESWEG